MVPRFGASVGSGSTEVQPEVRVPKLGLWERWEGKGHSCKQEAAAARRNEGRGGLVSRG